MPLPTSFTEVGLKVWMARTINTLAGALDWSIDDGDYDQAVDDALILYGVAEIADATDIGKLQAAARVAVFRNAELAAAGLVDHSVLGDSVKLSQIQTQIRASLAAAERQAVAYGLVTPATVVVTPVEYLDDPYVIHAADIVA